ncbi:hypothetical protein KPC_3587 [Acinetobacter stercoris]|uniref:Uncharacterized protein n=1 Tax=Acinetobacter stercoris TaxID=2126983 RepID=A0A2U3N4C2_9GAMM|nr:hypothetical protein KPC_3587 [Acinetobacter stercoris]
MYVNNMTYFNQPPVLTTTRFTQKAIPMACHTSTSHTLA